MTFQLPGGVKGQWRIQNFSIRVMPQKGDREASKADSGERFVRRK